MHQKSSLAQSDSRAAGGETSDPPGYDEVALITTSKALLKSEQMYVFYQQSVFS